MTDRPTTLPAFSDEAMQNESVRADNARRQQARAQLQALALLLLLPVLLIVFSLVVTAGSIEPAVVDTTRNRAFELGKSIELFKLQTGRFPNALSELTQPPQGRAILDTIPRDEWGKPFVYLLPGLRNQTKFDVVSYGEDGVPSTADDRGNFAE